MQRFNVHLKLARGHLSLVHSTTVKTDILEKFKKKHLKSVIKWVEGIRTMDERICGKDEF